MCKYVQHNNCYKTSAVLSGKAMHTCIVHLVVTLYMLSDSSSVALSSNLLMNMLIQSDVQPSAALMARAAPQAGRLRGPPS